jgi:hypothetical protein
VESCKNYFLAANIGTLGLNVNKNPKNKRKSFLYPPKCLFSLDRIFEFQ